MKQVTTLRIKANRKHAKKELSIHEISPVWTRILAMVAKTEQQEFYNNGQRLDISDCRFCVVGEAHGFKDSYSRVDNKDFCYDCYASAINFAHSLMLNPSEREGLTNTFADHWNESHV